MAVTFKGGASTTKVPPSSRLRVVWRWTLSGILNPVFGSFGFDAPGIAQKIQEALPNMGYVPVSLPNAAAGEEVIVYNVMVSSQQPTRTLGEHAAMLEKVPVSSLLGGAIVTVSSVELLYTVTQLPQGGVKLEGPGGTAAPSSSEQEKALATAKNEAQADAKASNVADAAGNAAKGFWKELRGVVGDLALPLGIVAGGIGLYYLNKSGLLKKVGKK